MFDRWSDQETQARDGAKNKKSPEAVLSFDHLIEIKLYAVVCPLIYFIILFFLISYKLTEKSSIIFSWGQMAQHVTSLLLHSHQH